jgi:nitrate/TMAO reductase-like tetraheme cytochrome c subunit
MFHCEYGNFINLHGVAGVEARCLIVHLVAVPSPKTETTLLNVSPTSYLTHVATRIWVANTSHYCVICHLMRPCVLTGCTAVFLADLAAGGRAASFR